MRTRIIGALAAILMLAACGEDEPVESESWQTSRAQAASGPVGLGDTVAFVDGATTDLELTVLDAGSGEIRFTRAWSPSARSSGMGVGRPALFAGAVVGMQASDFKTLIVAWDPQSGEELWQQEVDETFGPFVCGELVCSEDNWSLESAALVARDPVTGDTEWTSPGSQRSLYRDDPLLVTIDLNEPVVASIDPATGQDRWRIDLRASLGPLATPVIAEGVLVNGILVIESNSDPAASNGTVGIDPGSGAVLWNHPGFGLCPQPAPDVLAVCGAGSGAQRLDPATGQPVWAAAEYTYPQGPGPILGVTIDLSQMIGNAAEGAPIAINLADGSVSPAPSGLSWMRFVSRENAKKGPGTPAGEYFGPLDPVPWDAAAATPAGVPDADSVPGFIGLTLEGKRIFLDAGGNLQGIPAG